MKIAYNPTGGSALSKSQIDSLKNDIIFDLSGMAVYARGIPVGKVYLPFEKSTSSTTEGYNGLVPFPDYNGNSKTRFLREDGTWVVPTNNYRPISINGTPILENNNTALNLVAGTNITLSPKKDSNNKHTGEITITASNPTWDNITEKPTTLSGYGIIDGVKKVSNISADVSESCVGYTTSGHNKVNGGMFTALGGTGLYGCQLLGGYTGQNLYYRGKNNGDWTDWKELAFTDTNALTPSGGTFTINGNLTATSFSGNLDGSYINKLTGYTKAIAISDITANDTLNTALGKLELKAGTAYDLVKGAYDGDGTIENLAEILKVLEGISDTETIQSIVGKYLPLSGGTMTGEIAFNIYGLTASDICPNIIAVFKAPRIQATDLICNTITLGTNSGSASSLPLTIRKYSKITSMNPDGLTNLINIGLDGSISSIGNIEISKESARYIVKTDSGVLKGFFGLSGNDTLGIWSNTLNEWLITLYSNNIILANLKKCNVGIRNSVPTCALDVTGAIKASEGITVSGTSDFSSGTIKFDTINIPTTSGGSTYGSGANGQVLKSNGSTVYWANNNLGYIGQTQILSFAGMNASISGLTLIKFNSSNADEFSGISVYDDYLCIGMQDSDNIDESDFYQGIKIDSGYNPLILNPGRSIDSLVLTGETIGSTTKPIYLKDGIITECTYSIKVVSELPENPDDEIIYFVI